MDRLEDFQAFSSELRTAALVYLRVIYADESQEFLGPMSRLMADRICLYFAEGNGWNGKTVTRAKIKPAND